MFLALVLGGGGTLRATGVLDRSQPSSPARVAGAASVQQRIPAHRLAVATHPSGATVTITAPGRPPHHFTAPFHAMVKEGHINLSVALPGRNPLTEDVSLDRNRFLELWLDPKGLLHHELGTFETGSNPKQVAFTPDGKQIWVTLLGGDGVQVFDTATRRLVDDIKLGQHGGVEVVFTGDGKTALVTQMETASVFEIDTATRTIRRHLFTHSAWSKVMALSPDEKTLYVANWSGDNVTELDLATGRVRRQISAVDTPRGLYVTPDGSRLFVAGFGHGELQRVNLLTGASKILLHTGGAMRHLVGDPAHGRLYADDMALDEVFVVDLATEKVRRLARTDHTPNTIDLTPDGKVLYVSNRGANNPISYYIPGPEWGTVLAIDAASGKILDAIVGGNQTTGLDVSPDGRILAFSDFLDNRVSLFAIPSYAVLANGNGGRAVAHLADLEK